jgi:crotonobetainyl-CoA:carnitine CoA-transferase CaiB-like acyl-CoA transferase
VEDAVVSEPTDAALSPDALVERFPELVRRHPVPVGRVRNLERTTRVRLIAQAATGIAEATCGADGTPDVLPAQALDHGAGHLLAATVLR